MITRNEEDNLRELLPRLGWTGEVVVVDSGSTDGTVEVARSHGCRVAIHEFDTFARQRNRALGLARGDWVFSLDADERPTARLVVEMRRAIGNPRYAAWRVPIRSEILGRRVRRGGTQDDRPVRLVRRRAGRWRGDVHETLAVAGRIGSLAGWLEHRTLPTQGALLEKIDRYTRLEAQGRVRAGQPPRRGDAGPADPRSFPPPDLQIRRPRRPGRLAIRAVERLQPVGAGPAPLAALARTAWGDSPAIRRSPSEIGRYQPCLLARSRCFRWCSTTFPGRFARCLSRRVCRTSSATGAVRWGGSCCSIPQRPLRPRAGQIAIDVELLRAPFDEDPFSQWSDHRPQRFAWQVGPLRPAEEIARVDKRALRRGVMARLQEELERRGGVWIGLAPYPLPYRSAFNWRIDYDAFDERDFARLQAVLSAREDAVTISSTAGVSGRLACAAACGRCRRHGYWHHTYRHTRTCGTSSGIQVLEEAAAARRVHGPRRPVQPIAAESARAAGGRPQF